MMLRKWDKLPENMQTDEVRKYYDILRHKKVSMFFKRCFDIVVSLLLLIILLPLFVILAIAIKVDSEGPVFYRQERVTRYGKHFRIYKFRTMVQNADKQGALVTSKGDSRITKVGKFIRKCRLDETSQLLNVLAGSMSFVGTRPEVPEYVEQYTPEMMATLLLPAGITSLASIYYKDEDELLGGEENSDKLYIEKILPDKMKYNLKAIEKFNFFGDIKIMFMTFFAVCGKKYYDKIDKNKENDN